MISRRTVLSTSAAGAAVWAAGPAAAVTEGPDLGPSAATDGSTNVFNIISDIQGDLNDFAAALKDIAAINPRSTGLAIAGDITPRGYDFEYVQVTRTFAANPHATETAWAIGNHEFYVPKWAAPDKLAQSTWPNGATEDSLFRSFYNFAGRNKVYNEQSFGGIPVLMIGTEKYMHYHDAKLWDEVWMSDEQFTWLEDRLWYWRRRQRPVMVISHHPLPDTVTSTRNRRFMNDYLQADRLLQVLGRHPDVFFFTGHTHRPLETGDWYVRRVVPGTANLDGFHTINTGAIETGWLDNPDGVGEVVTGGFNQGLQIEAGPRWVTVKARDFMRREWIKQVRIPLSGTR
ncbi:DUF4073 domain-containing protein [Streptomyces sp. NPDC046821]|uniref:DUF4073 domain-containing protein n=1 Tax=Streptomyces sp. NPDC046821 TaxID=3154702 RepID=UPI0033DB7FA3